LNTFDKSRVINNKTTSGRVELWNEVLNKYDKKRFFGYGPQADRNLIGRELERKYSNNVSNAYLYSFACGGYLAIIIFIIISIQIITNLYKAIFIKGLFLNKNNIETKYSATLLFYFLIRSFIENSYSLFSIDFLLVIIAMSIIKEFVSKKI
jgi:O-antigen ligase